MYSGILKNQKKGFTNNICTTAITIRRATLFVYPSFFEGFGIPILEAQLAGIPVIAATGSCLEEAGGSSALYTDPRNEQELRSLIESVLNEPKLAESMRSGGRENIRRFMPDVLAAHFMRVYENISRS